MKRFITLFSLLSIAAMVDANCSSGDSSCKDENSQSKYQASNPEGEERSARRIKAAKDLGKDCDDCEAKTNLNNKGKEKERK